MNIKISNDKPTEHILIALMNYCVDKDIEDCQKYGFGYFELTGRPVFQINEFLDNWENGIRNYRDVIIDIPEFYLIDADYIFKVSSSKIKSDFKGVKLDSINFLKERPDLNPNLTKLCKGAIIVNRSDFFVHGDNIPGNSSFAKIIYRSSITSYWKINHLLNRVKPI